MKQYIFVQEKYFRNLKCSNKGSKILTTFFFYPCLMEICVIRLYDRKK